MFSLRTLALMLAASGLTLASPAASLAARFPATGSTNSHPGTEAALYGGDMTYYYPEGAAGSCGGTNVSGDHVVALSAAEFGNKATCGRNIRIHNAQGASVTATVVDLCPGCGPGSIDVTPSVFFSLADLG
ncbi:RlpA-like double-psi beta-barrel-protein domain-containing protein-containing protein [Xylariaceae sp. FL0594]|nr:RlpA-like double-psi beta-barrel-protein domain-containing protein-containing protein [Xylariaceae sp. FL0594]